MMTSINLGALRISQECGDLYGVVKRTTGFITGTHEVDIPSLPISPQARFRLAQWSLLMNAAVVEHEQQSLRSRAERIAPVVAPRVIAESAAPVVVKPAEPLPPQIDMGEVLREEQTARQKSADLTRAEQRLEQYAVEQGLERTHANAQAVADFIDASPVHGYWSREIIDAAIQNLGPKGTNVLTWMPRTAPAPPPPEESEPTEILEPWQLPLDKAPTNKASAVQVKDWLARTREATGKYLRPRGSFSSKF